MNLSQITSCFAAIMLCASAASTAAAPKPRARELGIPLDGTPGQLNAITDVASVAVGYTTLIEGSGKNAVRTGVTAILPRGRATLEKSVFARSEERRAG